MIGFLLLWAAATAPVTTRAPVDVSWVLDEELSGRASAADQEAGGLAGKAAAAEAKRAELAASRDADAKEAARIEPTLPALSRSQRSLAESHLADLKERISEDGLRLGDLEAEIRDERSRESADRAFASASRAEAVRRSKAAAAALGPEVDLGPLPNTRLLAARGYYEEALRRVPAQLSALDAATVREQTQAGRMEVIGRTEALRAKASAMAQMVTRIDDELAYRRDSKVDEAREAAALDAAAKAKAAEDLPQESAAETSAHSAAIDRVLDRIIAEQDAEAARSKARSDTLRTVARLGLALAVGLAGIGGLWYLLSRKEL